MIVPKPFIIATANRELTTWDPSAEAFVSNIGPKSRAKVLGTATVKSDALFAKNIFCVAARIVLVADICSGPSQGTLNALSRTLRGTSYMSPRILSRPWFGVLSVGTFILAVVIYAVKLFLRP